MMEHRKLLADTFSGLTRGMTLLGFSSYFLQGFTQDFVIPFFVCSICLAILLQILAHQILAHMTMEVVMEDWITIAAAFAVGITAIIVIIGMFQLNKANKLKERALQLGNVPSQAFPAQVGHGNGI